MTVPTTTVEPGLFGHYHGSCVVCLRGTDTALAFQGEAEWMIAGVSALGVPLKQAGVMVSHFFGCLPGRVPDGDDLTIVVQVCSSCVAKAKPGFPVPGLVVGGRVPTIGQPRR